MTKIVLAFSLSVFFIAQMNSQTESPLRDDGFGFNFAFVYGQVNLQTNLPDSTGARIWAQNQGGLSMGLVYHKAIDPRISIRPQLNITFLDNIVMYEDNDGTSVQKDIFPAFVEIPIHLHFTNKALSNNISVLFGVKLTKSLNGKPDSEFILRDSFTSAEFGLGKEFELERFRIAPEVSYSFGLENLFRYSTLPAFSTGIEQLTLNQLSIRVLFY